MNYFIDFLENIKNAVFISSSDSDEERAKKIIWYAFFGSLFMIFVISYTIFVLFTFTGKGVKVPNLEGDNIYTALRKISDKDLMIKVLPKYSDSCPESVVFGQNPSHGTYVKTGRTVTVFVSMGKRDHALPDFTGMTLFDIASFLDREYRDGKIPYKVSERIYEYSDSIDRGRVIKQEPVEGTPLKGVKNVKLWVSNGMKIPGVYSIQDYKGQRLYDVLKKLEKLEVNANINFIETDKRGEHYTVVEQDIQAGTLVDEIVKNNRVFVITSKIYIENKKDNIKDFLSIALPRKNIPYKLSVSVSEDETKHEDIFTMSTKGGFDFKLPYSLKKFTKVTVIGDGDIVKEFTAGVEK